MAKYQEINHLTRVKDFFREWFLRNLNLNFISYRFLWNFVARYDHVTKFPLHLDIETTDSCNLKCVMCVHGIGDGVPDTGMIDMNFAKKMIDQAVKGGTRSVKFNWRGEPALHKGLEELVREAKDKGILEVQINTNGIPFTEKRIRSIIDCGLDRIIFSMDGATKETYEKIRVKADFDKLMKNIKLFHEIRSEKKQVKPFIRIQMVKMKDNENEVNKFINMWKNFADDIVVKDVTDRGQGGEFYAGNQVAVGRKRCNQPWQRMIVARDGKVFPCCSDWDKHWEIGDANKTPLADIWKGKKMSQMRQINREKKLNDYDPCAHCFVLSSYEWKKINNKQMLEKNSSILVENNS